MATPPTFVAEYEATWTNTAAGASKTVDVTVANGDIIVVLGGSEQGGGVTLGTPTGGGLTYTSRQAAVNGGSWSTAYIWTAPSTSAQTFTLQITCAGGSSGSWGFNVLRFSGHGGVGASSNTNVSGAAPSLGLTTTGNNSAIAIINTDWNAADGTTRTWRTVGAAATEQTYYRDSSAYAAYVGRHIDAGTAGAKTVGLSAPSGQKYTIAAVEILGTSGTTVSDPPHRRNQLAALLDM